MEETQLARFVISSQTEKRCADAATQVRLESTFKTKASFSAGAAPKDFYYPNSIGCPSPEMTTRANGATSNGNR